MQEIPSRDSVAIERFQLRRFRHKRRYTQAKLAEIAGMSPEGGYIGHLERGTRTHVSRDTFERLCAALGVRDQSELIAAVQSSAVAAR
jgi:transcriptional regulator with XRE-family HTH domain